MQLYLRSPTVCSLSLSLSLPLLSLAFSLSLFPPLSLYRFLFISHCELRTCANKHTLNNYHSCVLNGHSELKGSNHFFRVRSISMLPPGARRPGGWCFAAFRSAARGAWRLPGGSVWSTKMPKFGIFLLLFNTTRPCCCCLSCSFCFRGCANIHCACACLRACLVCSLLFR